MATQTAQQLGGKHCEACEGKGKSLPLDQAREQLEALCHWQLAEDGKQITKEWLVTNFAAGITFLDKVAQLAEQEGHHPDLHLEGYRHVRINLSTHAVDGLSDNDFILAAKIDRLPVELKK
jgi:4a-hydroxytetrahydrobiopterin dehydratase